MRSKSSAAGSYKAAVKGNHSQKDILIHEVVAGDIILLHAGDIIPADCYILQANDLHINESVLTGESFPAEKFFGDCAVTAPLSIFHKKSNTGNCFNLLL